MSQQRETVPDVRAGTRAAKTAERRRAILEAALATFSEQGFAAARMEDVARRAGVAKGTIYLHFADKEELFGGIVRHAMVSTLDATLRSPPVPGESTRDFLRRALLGIAAEFKASPRREVLQLLIGEGPRFPQLTEFYFREVVEPGLTRLAELGRQAARSGDLAERALPHFPQLAMAPILVGVLWSMLFARLLPIDVGALVESQLDLMFGPAKP